MHDLLSVTNDLEGRDTHDRLSVKNDLGGRGTHDRLSVKTISGQCVHDGLLVNSTSKHDIQLVREMLLPTGFGAPEYQFHKDCKNVLTEAGRSVIIGQHGRRRLNCPGPHRPLRIYEYDYTRTTQTARAAT